MVTNEGNIWFQKYVDSVTKELKRLDINLIECSKCVKEKMTKLKPQAIIGIIGIFLVSFGVVTGATSYMIRAETTKIEGKLDAYCKKDAFHAVDKKLGVVEEKVKNIDAKVEEMNKRSKNVWEAIERMERKSNSTNDYYN